MAFLPTDYTTPVEKSDYAKLAIGENQFRILSEAVTGYEYWTEEGGKRKPNRVRLYEELPREVTYAGASLEKAKHFWAFAVLNKQTNDIQILELTQKTLIKDIEGLFRSKSWGDPRAYDLVIIKTKTGSEPRDVEYSVRPEPKEELDEAIAQLYASMAIDLEKLFDGGNPFGEAK